MLEAPAERAAHHFFFRSKLPDSEGGLLVQPNRRAILDAPCIPGLLMRQESHRRAAERHLRPSGKTGRDWPVMRVIRSERHFDGMAFRPSALAVTRAPVVTSLATRKGGAELPYPQR